MGKKEFTGTQFKKRALLIQAGLVKAFGTPAWSEPVSALDELISTILSQNTNDRNRDAAFILLKAQFPSWEDVRDAPEEKVVKAIRTAGLANIKGPRIQSILKQITEECRDLNLEFLRSYSSDEAKEWLLRFKGVGPKTASIVMQFALGHPAFPVDTHIYRVTGRLGLRPAKMNVENAHAHLASLFPVYDYGTAHLNLIRLGRDFCHPRKPNCQACPLKKWCDYFYHLDKD